MVLPEGSCRADAGATGSTMEEEFPDSKKHGNVGISQSPSVS